MSGKLHFGASKVDITPEIGCRLFGYTVNFRSESVHDNLTLTAFAFKYGDAKALMISAFVCSIDTKVSDELRAELGKMLDIPAENIIISATHTHTGPAMQDMAGWGGIDEEYYTSIFKPAIIRASAEAFENLEPVKVAVASGDSYVGVNRRELRSNNQIRLGQCPWGIFNPKMTIISFKGENGVVANIISYGCHCTASGRSHEISRDWPGEMIDKIEAVSGGITAFFNGPEGDVGPRLSDGSTAKSIALMEEISKIAVADALKIYNSISSYEDVSLDIASRIIKMPLTPRISYEEASEMVDTLKKSESNLGKHINEYYENVKLSYENGYTEQEYVELPQTVLRIGNVVFVTFPFELFSEIGLRIDNAVKEFDVISLSLSNGSLGYLPTKDQLCRAGYEIAMFKYDRVQPYTEDADFVLLNETLENIKTLQENN